MINKEDLEEIRCIVREELIAQENRVHQQKISSEYMYETMMSNVHSIFGESYGKK